MEVIDRYQILRRTKNSRSAAIQLLQEEFEQELSDDEDAISVKLGITIALSQKKELTQEALYEAQRSISLLKQRADEIDFALPQDLNLQIFYTPPNRDALFSAIVRSFVGFSSPYSSFIHDNDTQTQVLVQTSKQSYTGSTTIIISGLSGLTAVIVLLILLKKKKKGR